MTVYLVVSLPAYETGTVYGTYSTRALAENSWHMKYEKYNEVIEFELDLDPSAEEGDPGEWHGPQTEAQFQMSQMFNKIYITNLTAPTPFMTKRSMPMNSGNTIQFFTPGLPK